MAAYVSGLVAIVVASFFPTMTNSPTPAGAPWRVTVGRS